MNCIETKQMIVLFLFLLIPLQWSLAQNEILNTKINVAFEDIEIKEALLSLGESTGLKIAFNERIMGDEKLTATFDNKSLAKVLEGILAEVNLAYKVIGSTVTIFQNEEASKSKPQAKPKKIQVNILSGFVYDASSGEALIGANVYEQKHQQATISNEFGFFSLTLKKDIDLVTVSYIGYETQQIEVKGTKEIIIKLVPRINKVTEVNVIAAENKQKERLQKTGMSTNELAVKEVKNLPSLGGETDVLKTLNLLPGIKQGEDGTAGFYVRGGNIDQNLILMDGVPLYNPYHLFGYFSTFNPDAINNIEITKAAFPARYGGRLSSVVNITMKEGNDRDWETKMTIGLLSAKVSVGGPLVKGKSSMIFSARRSYLDIPYGLIVNSIASDGEKAKHKINLTDLNLKLNYRLSPKDRLYFSSYFSRDVNDFNFQSVYTFGNDEFGIDQNWKTGILSFRWNHLFSNKLFSNTTAYYTHYSFNYDLINNNSIIVNNFKQDFINSNKMESVLNDFGVKQDYQFYLNEKNVLRFGLGGILHNYDFGVSSMRLESFRDTADYTTPKNPIRNAELSLYVEDEVDLFQSLKINAGLHFSSSLSSKKSYHSLQPRLGLRYLLNDQVALKAGYSDMTQFVHLLSQGSVAYRTNIWIPVSDKLKPQKSKQYSLGTYVNLSKDLSLEVEGYYKETKGLIAYKPGASFILQEGTVEDKITIGDGEAYGAEVFFKKDKGRFTGWLAYTLSWSTRQFDEINFREKYFDTYDRRHDVSITANYTLNKKWSLHAVWVFATGGFSNFSTHSYTVPNYDPNANSLDAFWSYQEFEDGGTSEIVGISEIFNTADNGVVHSANRVNEYRLPNYHRLDFTLSKRKTTKRNNLAELRFGVTNVYNKFNPTFYRPNFNEEEEGNNAKYEAVSVFPTMPFFNYSITF